MSGLKENGNNFSICLTDKVSTIREYKVCIVHRLNKMMHRLIIACWIWKVLHPMLFSEPSFLGLHIIGCLTFFIVSFAWGNVFKYIRNISFSVILPWFPPVFWINLAWVISKEITFKVSLCCLSSDCALYKYNNK